MSCVVFVLWVGWKEFGPDGMTLIVGLDVVSREHWSVRGHRRAQWLRGRPPDSRLREPGFESCAAVLKPWASFFTLHCSSSLSCINEYLAIDSGGYVYVQPFAH